MKLKIIIAGLIDQLVSMMIISLLTREFFYKLASFVENSFSNGELVISNTEFTVTYLSMFLGLFFVVIVLHLLFSSVLKIFVLLVTKKYTIGLFLMKLKLKNVHDEELDYTQIIKRVLLYDCLLSFFSLYIFKLCELYKLINNKELYLDKKTKTKITEDI